MLLGLLGFRVIRLRSKLTDIGLLLLFLLKRGTFLLRRISLPAKTGAVTRTLKEEGGLMVRIPMDLQV